MGKRSANMDYCFINCITEDERYKSKGARFKFSLGAVTGPQKEKITTLDIMQNYKSQNQQGVAVFLSNLFRIYPDNMLTGSGLP